MVRRYPTEKRREGRLFRFKTQPAEAGKQKPTYRSLPKKIKSNMPNWRAWFVAACNIFSTTPTPTTPPHSPPSRIPPHPPPSPDDPLPRAAPLDSNIRIGCAEYARLLLVIPLYVPQEVMEAAVQDLLGRDDGVRWREYLEWVRATTGRIYRVWGLRPAGREAMRIEERVLFRGCCGFCSRDGALLQDVEENMGVDDWARMTGRRAVQLELVTWLLAGFWTRDAARRERVVDACWKGLRTAFYV